MKRGTLKGGQFIYDCPACDTAHAVTVDGSAAYTFTGSMELPTIAPAILVRQNDGRCHHFIRDGYIIYRDDSTHELSGQAILVPERN